MNTREHGGTSTVEKVVAEAAEIRAKARAAVAAGRRRDDPALFREMAGAHRDFAQTYTVPFRFIVELDRYNARVFENFLKGLRGQKFGDQDAFLDSQAAYAAALFRAEDPRRSAAEVRRYRQDVRRSLGDDAAAFDRAKEEAEAEMARLERERAAERREALMRYLTAKKAERLGVEPAALDRAMAALALAKAERADESAAAIEARLGDDESGKAALRAAYAEWY